MVSWMPVSIAILTLVPTPSLAATSTGSLKPARLRSNRPPKPPISASAPGPRRRPHQRLDQLDHAVAGIDIDAGLRIGEALFAHAFAYVGIETVCNGSIADILRRNRKRAGPGSSTGARASRG